MATHSNNLDAQRLWMEDFGMLEVKPGSVGKCSSRHLSGKHCIAPHLAINSEVCTSLFYIHCWKQIDDT